MDPRKIAITLVCAGEDERAVEPVLDRLRARGRADLEVELVAGVDGQPRRIGEALDRCGEWGVLVVCVSKRLDGSELRKIEGLFGARRGPNHVLVRVDLGQPSNDIVAAIQRAVAALAANSASRPSGADGGRVRRPTHSEPRKRRDVVAVPELTMPVVRLGPDEDIEGDTGRVEFRDKLGRRATGSGEPLPASRPTPLDEDAAKLDRMMIVMIIGAGVLAVLTALSFAGFQ